MTLAATHTPPKLSVVMSVYNAEHYLSAAMESVLTQSYTDFEFVIIDDGSTDKSPEILQEYAAKDDRIRIITQKNTGLTVALCTGCDIARGEYIARMDADDYSLPSRFEKQVALLDANPDLVAATGDVEHFTDDGTVLTIVKLDQEPKLIRFYNCFVNYIGGHGQVMFRRDVYDKVGGYDPTFRMSQDYDLWAKLLTQGDFGIVPETIYRFRTGHDSISKLSKNEQAHHSQRTCRRLFENMTGSPLDEDAAMILHRFFFMAAPQTGLGKGNFAASAAMNKVSKAFFKQYPDLRSAHYRIFKDFASKWWWWSKRVPPYSIDRGIFLCSSAYWGTRAVWARLRHGS